MPLAEGTEDELWTEFLRRYDVAMFRLQRDHPWARRTLRNLTPTFKRNGALSVDKWLRLYANPKYVLGMWTQEQLTTAIWHECHHILRGHEARLGGDGHDHHLANVAADLEINGDLIAQGAAMPPSVLNHENQGMEAFVGTEAERMYAELVWRKANEPKSPSPDPDGDGDDESDGDEQEGDSDQSQPGEDGGKSGDSKGSSKGQGGSSDDGGEDESQEDTSADGSSKQNPDVGDEEDDEDGDADDDTEDYDDEDGEDEDDSEDEQVDPMGCGSGAGGDEQEDELGEPEPDEQARLDRDQRRQAEDTIDEAEHHGYSDTTEAVYKVAKMLVGTSEIDWRKEIAPFIRQSFEQVMDEAEEYTFKHRSRRQAAIDDVLLPGSFRPTPKLAVVVDVSGSMDFGKLQLALQEVHGIMDRLAIPTFMAIPFCTGPMLDYPVQVHTPTDIMAVLENVGGGTDMLEGVRYAVEDCGAEVVVVLTDCDCEWDPWPWSQRGIPIIIGGVKCSTHRRAMLPKGVPFIDVKEVASP